MSDSLFSLILISIVIAVVVGLCFLDPWLRHWSAQRAILRTATEMYPDKHFPAHWVGVTRYGIDVGALLISHGFTPQP